MDDSSGGGVGLIGLIPLLPHIIISRPLSSVTISGEGGGLSAGTDALSVRARSGLAAGFADGVCFKVLSDLPGAADGCCPVDCVAADAEAWALVVEDFLAAFTVFGMGIAATVGSAEFLRRAAALSLRR